MLDLLIRGGTVIDGTGAPGFSADVAVEGGVIAAVEPLPPDTPARRVIHAAGKLVTPGFIDIHRHADAAAFRPGFGELELRQGLTTIVNGNCGLSAAPFGPAHREEILAYLAPITGEAPPELETETLAGYFASQPPAPIHTGMLVGAGVLRADAAGYALQRLEKRHYDAIHRSMERALSDGAVGVSLGLGYAPECFYTTRELIEALRPLSGGDVPVTVHMRQEGAGVVDSVREMLTVARTLRIPLQISHLKAMGRDSWGKKIPQVLELLEEARQEGFDEIARLFEGVGAIEKTHEERYRKLLANVREGLVFSRDGDRIWECSNCGHIVIGPSAPEVCPVCRHPKAYFKLKAENY